MLGFLPPLIIAALLLSTSQKKKDAAVVPTQESWLSRYDLSDKHPQQFRLPKRLSEASGLAMSDDGRLFCHDDESATVYQVDYANGKIVKQFSLGSGFLKGDFEGIAIKKDTLYMVESNGNIFAFREGENNSRVKFQMYRTSLSHKNDVEGLEYDPETDCLLLACKGEPSLTSGKKKHHGYKAVYAFSLKTYKLLEKPRFLIPLDAVTKSARNGQFNPSGIARHPKSGTYFIITADGESIIELSRDGKILAQQEISKKANSQPEGIAFAPDLSMILCNDGQGGSGTLTVYPPKER
jgi:uncharacterized protein YjiK